MEIDFHFGTVYILARWAGFQHDGALTIATSSQFVDDNTPTCMSKVKKLIGRNGRVSGHYVWHNLQDKVSNDAVWLPFHFLPSFEGETLEQEMICQKHSKLAREVRSHICKSKCSDYCKIGILLHVYADTWAHQHFSGLICAENTGKLEVVHDIDGCDILGVADRCIFTSAAEIMSLGHVAAGAWPDMPYVSWQYVSPSGYRYIQCNWQEFLEAAEDIFAILTYLYSGEEKELTVEQKGKLTETFTTIKKTNGISRCKKWVELIRRDKFNISLQSHENIGYDIPSLLNNRDFLYNFYIALEEYYNWIMPKIKKDKSQHVASATDFFQNLSLKKLCIQPGIIGVF